MVSQGRRYFMQFVKKITATLLTATALSFIATHSANACTDFRLIAKDGTVMVTRTMEFGTPMNSNLMSTPEDTVFQNTAPDGKPGLSWKAKYGYVYLDGMGIATAIDGMNEVGLSAEGLLFPTEAGYQTVTPGSEKSAVSYRQLNDWILGNFKTVQEVKAALPAIQVYAEKIPGFGNMIFPLHIMVNDASGKSLVIEYVDGKLHTYDSVGVMTNSPTYDWHVTNLRNYLNLSPVVPEPVTAGNIVFAATGQGTGMVGLPGDASPPSRFVKIALLLNAATPVENASAELILAQHIINNVDIPLGTVRSVTNGVTEYDSTQWTIFKDLTHKKIYFRTYNNTALRSVSLDKIDLSSHAKILKMPIDNNTNYTQDVTNTFLNSAQMRNN